MDELLYRLALSNNGTEELFTAQSPIHGTGLFTEKALPAGTLICRLLEVKSLLSSKDWLVEPFKWLNHSAEPNACLTGTYALVSVGNIGAGEEICIDYSTLPADYHLKIPGLQNYNASEEISSELGETLLDDTLPDASSYETSRQLPGTNNEDPFVSFWMGGFECTDQLNNTGERVDLLTSTRHLDFLDEDYERLKTFGIRTVREGIRWSQVEKRPYEYDFRVVRKMLEAGKRHGVQQVWDICHFGFPDDLSPLHPKFTERFVGICAAFAEFHRKNYPEQVLIVTPINEVSFLSWLGGEAAGTAPFCRHNGWEVKYHLMKAYIQGIKGLKLIDPDIRILTTEPLVNIVPPLLATPEEIEQASAAHLEQYQSLDILAGYICPELGGSPELLDLLGFNFYYNNQWLTGFQYFLPWLNEEPDPRWRPLHSLLSEAYNRYGRPMVLTETSHPGEDRPKWIRFISSQCQTLLDTDIPFYGICLYPIIDRPDWDNLECWHHSGLWDREADTDEASARILNLPYANALLESQKLVTGKAQIFNL